MWTTCRGGGRVEGGDARRDAELWVSAALPPPPAPSRVDPRLAAVSKLPPGRSRGMAVATTSRFLARQSQPVARLAASISSRQLALIGGRSAQRTPSSSVAPLPHRLCAMVRLWRPAPPCQRKEGTQEAGGAPLLATLAAASNNCRRPLTARFTARSPHRAAGPARSCSRRCPCVHRSACLRRTGCSHGEAVGKQGGMGGSEPR